MFHAYLSPETSNRRPFTPDVCGTGPYVLSEPCHSKHAIIVAPGELMTRGQQAFCCRAVPSPANNSNCYTPRTLMFSARGIRLFATMATPGRVQQAIEAKLKEKLSPLFLEVVNESYKHAVPKGSETHFKVSSYICLILHVD